MENEVKNEYEGFICDTDAKADWCIEKIRKARENQKANAETAKAIIAQKQAEVEAWLAEQDATDESTILRMQAFLEPYVQEKLKDSKKKSFKLPSGSAGYKKQGPKFTWKGMEINAAVKQDADFSTFADKLDSCFVNIKTEVAWAKLKQYLVVDDEGNICTKDGEVIDNENLTAKVMPDKFVVG